MIIDNKNIKPGEIRYVDFGKGTACMQGGVRPALIAQNEIGCRISPIIRVIPLTSKVEKAKSKNLPMHIFVPRTEKNGLKYDSIALTEQELPVLKKRIGECIGIMEKDIIQKCGKAFMSNSSLFQNADDCVAT